MADLPEGMVTSASEVTPRPAPVGEPRWMDKAGIYLTFTVLAIIAVFLLGFVLVLWGGEVHSYANWQKYAFLLKDSTQSGTARIDTVAARVLDAQQSAFRSFSLEVLKTVLLNALLPVLTALLGYVFGTQSKPPT